MKRTSPVLILFFLPTFLLGQPKESWPHVIPVRSQDGPIKDVFVLTLGNVQTPLADGEYDPSEDELRLKNGIVIKNYYRDSLGVKYFAPIDKSSFPLPPSGWCSWYYYYQEINEDEIRRNAKWIADNLKDYGAVYVQIDDGWQGSGHGNGENRDWTIIDKRFGSGMDRLASYIKSLGLKPGLWLAPHGQSNENVVRANPGVFLLKQNDSTASNTWEGTYLMDPSTASAQSYLKNLFSTLSRWGYEYFKIDGQPIVIEEYKKKKSFMKNPNVHPDSLYRSTLLSIRSVIGTNQYLLGCWGIPLEGTGIMNGSRTGSDVLLGWSGFKEALSATMKHYFLHNIVWYCDPDVMLLRSPLTLDQARAWATLQGLTGQALMASDRMMDLSEERVEILKRVFPAVDVRPLDLFSSKHNKHIWDLKVNHLGRTYDVVGLFNYDEIKTQTYFLSWRELGIAETTPVHMFDFWNKEYLGAWEKGIAVTVSPTSCRVLTILPSENHIQLVSTSRHITQGWVDLVKVAYNEKTNTYSGRSRLVKNDPYELRFTFPRGMNFLIKNAKAGALPVKVMNHQGWAAVQFTSPTSTEIDWQVSFESSDFYHYPTYAPYGLIAERVGFDGVNVRWSDNYNLNAGYQVYLNGSLLGYTPTNTFPIRHLNIDSTYLVSVRTVWEDGRTSKEDARAQFTIRSMLPDELFLDELEPTVATAGWGSVEMNKSVSGKKLSLGGKQFDHGIGTHANSEILFDTQGLYEQFSVTVGIDENNSKENQGSVEFIILGDGHELWRSGIMKKPDARISFTIDIKNVRRLLLKVTDAGDGINYDHADWANAKLSLPSQQNTTNKK